MRSESMVVAVAAASFLVAMPAAQDARELGTGGLAPTTFADWRAVAAGDLDGDGDLDQVFACFGSPGAGQRNFWLKNDGTGLFDPTGDAMLQLAPSLSRAVILRDFDGDGDLDAFFGNQRHDALCVNDGTGRLVLAPAALPAVDRETRAAAAGDLDGDGDLDVVAACGGTSIVYRNLGAGTFSHASTALPAGWTDTRDLDLGDFDGDGDLDLVLVHADAPSQLLWNDGTGTFTASAAPLPGGTWIAGGDADGDGDRDLWLGTYSVSMPFQFFGRVLLRNGGSGGFTVQTYPTNSPFVEQRGGVADVDGDGDLDLAIAGDAIHFNDGTGTFIAGPRQPWLGRSFADVDGDGDLDLLGDPTLRNDGTGVFPRDPAPEVLAADQGAPLALCDFDGDGDVDLVRGDLFSTASVAVLANDGRGAFRTVLAQAANNTWGPLPWQAVDLDGNGLVDVFQRYTDRWFRNTGGAGLTVTALPTQVWDALALDADGDGDLDLIGTNGQGALWWLRNVAGTFAAPIPVAGAIGRVHAVGDVDGDQRADVVWATTSGELRISRCTGNGVFTPVAGAVPAGLLPALTAEHADLDGDGDLDLVVGHDFAAVAGARATVLANDGTGQFAVATVLVDASVLGAVQGVVPADLDADGDLDLLVRGAYVAGAWRVLRNDGGMVFADTTGGQAPWRGIPLAPGGHALTADLDGDGDQDVVAGDNSSTRVLRNLQRQLTSRGGPRRGANWRLEILQRPIGGSFGAVLVGTGELAPALATPFGALRVDPSGAVLFALVPVAVAGPVEALTLAIPPDPSLAGFALFAQHVAFDGTTVVLGNQIAAVVP